ncbi:MAG: hypothetical protein M3Q22_04745, partial [Actinomycetota bacterium]|nr:hypothetical protein [Actinomycetota bacterium]
MDEPEPVAVTFHESFRDPELPAVAFVPVRRLDVLKAGDVVEDPHLRHLAEAEGTSDDVGGETKAGEVVPRGQRRLTRQRAARSTEPGVAACESPATHITFPTVETISLLILDERRKSPACLASATHLVGGVVYD